MARGSQHRKRRPAQNARNAAVAASATTGRRGRQKPPQWQEQLFFQRLRVHAKWAYVALAAAFLATFVLLGVGSGSTGISDAFQNLFNRSSSGTSISKLQHKVAKHPQDAKTWRDLATALEQKQRTQDAVDALERYTALRPKDQGALAELASQYGTLASTYAADYTTAQSQATAASLPSNVFPPAASSPFGKAFDDEHALKDPIAAAVTAVVSSKTQTAYSKYQGAQQNAEAAYKRLGALNPNDATTQIQLGQAAEAAQDTKTAIAAYRRFLKLAPTDTSASSIRQRIKQLRQSAAATTSSTGRG